MKSVPVAQVPPTALASPLGLRTPGSMYNSDSSLCKYLLRASFPKELVRLGGCIERSTDEWKLLCTLIIRLYPAPALTIMYDISHYTDEEK